MSDSKLETVLEHLTDAIGILSIVALVLAGQEPTDMVIGAIVLLAGGAKVANVWKGIK